MTPKDQQKKALDDSSDDDGDVLLVAVQQQQDGKKAAEEGQQKKTKKKIQETETATNQTTRLVTPINSAPYVICTSTKEYVNPTTSTHHDGVEKEEPLSADKKLLQMNLDLGLPSLLCLQNKHIKLVLWLIKFFDQLLLTKYYELIFFKIWKDYVPLKLKRSLTFGGWNIYKKLHKLILGKSTGLHQSQSYEYHALTTIVWFCRFFPVTPQRCDFSLSQLHVWSPNTVNLPSSGSKSKKNNSSHVETICCSMKGRCGIDIPSEQTNHSTVKGLYIHYYNNNNKNQKNQQKMNQSSSTTTSNKNTNNNNNNNIIFWIYGGAYIGGDTIGNSAAADYVSLKTNMDVFIPEFRLAPKANLFDVLWDITLAYRWLIEIKTNIVVDNNNNNTNYNNSNNNTPSIYLWGISSGGASVIRLMQLILEQQDQHKHKTIIPNYIPDLFGIKPINGAVLFGPYCDYDYKSNDFNGGSWEYYDRIDLIVTEAVKECGLKHLDDFIPGTNNNYKYSPVNNNMDGLPPLCVIVSEHEVVYDMTMKLVNRARKQGVPVTVGVWKYMCHVFSFLWGFIPEGEESLEFACRWLNNSQQQKQKQQRSKLLMPIEEEEKQLPN